MVDKSTFRGIALLFLYFRRRCNRPGPAGVYQIVRGFEEKTFDLFRGKRMKGATPDALREDENYEMDEIKVQRPQTSHHGGCRRCADCAGGLLVLGRSGERRRLHDVESREGKSTQ